MGLDGVEIVMAVEDAFDIKIEDADAEKLLTPGQLIDLVMSKVQITTASACLTQRSFNLLRRFFVAQVNLSRSQFAPGTRLQNLLPPKQRPSSLALLSTSLSVTAPQLVRPDWLKALLAGATVLTGLLVAAAFTNSPIPAWLAGLLAAIFTGFLAASATKGLRTEFPKDISTVADLCRWVMTHKGDLARPTVTAWTREQVATGVRDIVVRQLACEKKYREDALFVPDLGLD